MSLISDALQLLAECSPHVSEETRQQIELLFEESALDHGAPVSWNRTGDKISISFPKGALPDWSPYGPHSEWN